MNEFSPLTVLARKIESIDYVQIILYVFFIYLSSFKQGLPL